MAIPLCGAACCSASIDKHQAFSQENCLLGEKGPETTYAIACLFATIVVVVASCSSTFLAAICSQSA